MKSVLISIQPQWCELIASGKKTVEVRKTQPKLEPPFKCYIYCTKGQTIWTGKVEDYGTLTTIGNGKVIGEFVCDKITPFDVPYPAYQKELDKAILEQSCLTYYQLHRYAYHDKLYGWHISDLRIYDKPRPLSSFTKPYGTIVRAFDSPYIQRPPQSWCYVEGE